MFIVLSNKSCTQCNIRPCVPERFSYTAHCSSQKVSQASLRRYVWSWKEQLYMCTKVN